MDQASLDRPFLVFDGECPFCRAWVEYWKHLTGDRVLYAPYQEVGSGFPRTPREDFASAVKLILPDGEVRSGTIRHLLESEPVIRTFNVHSSTSLKIAAGKAAA